MPLTRLDKDLNFIPYLAEKWQFSDDRTVLTFFLRKDVQWTDGIKTTADDVVFTYEIATDPDVGYPAASRFDFSRLPFVLCRNGAHGQRARSLHENYSNVP